MRPIEAYRVRTIAETARLLGLRETQVVRAEASALRKLRVRITTIQKARLLK